MSATIKGLADLRTALASLPAKLEANVLRGAMRAGAEVVAEGARENCRSPEVRAAIKTKVKAEPGTITAKVYVDKKADGAYIAPWLEYGTDPHFISVDPEISGGRTAGRVNRQAKNGEGPAASLFINGKPVGKTVRHPGALPYPFMRPALDQNETAAVAAIKRHIAGRLTKAKIDTPDVGDDD